MLSIWLENTRMRFLVKLGLMYCGAQFLLRLVLLCFSRHDVSWAPLELVKTLLLGFGYDALVFLYLLLPVALLLLAKDKWLQRGLTRKILKGMLHVFALYSAFVLVSEFYFWDEFQTRYNFIAVDYLIYTQELFGNIFQSYNLLILVAVIGVLTGGFVWLIRGLLPSEFQATTIMRRLVGCGIYLALLIVGTLIFTSNAATWVSQNVYNQEVARNGVYQFVYAFFNNELDYNRFYRHRDEKSVIADLRQKLALPNCTFANDVDVTRNIHNHSRFSGKTPNICVIVVESLSARYTGMDGNQNSLTPRLDELMKKSFCYTNVYATGTRTVRGLEAVTLSVPPTPGQSILRRKDCRNLHTVGTQLRGHGYDTEFVYGGYGYFDNMNAYFEGNDFAVYDRNVIPKEEIFNDTIWGVADEILFDQVIKRLDVQYLEKEPTFQVVLTTTNHRPFVFPEGRVDAPQGVRDSVVVYTDWAIDDFLKKAQQKPWFDDTVFVILADHNALAAGRVELPVSSYKIPCIVYAPKYFAPGVNNRLMSQIDVLPTVFGMLGFSYQSKNLGYDINMLPAGEERMFISTYQQMGFVKGDKLCVLTPGNHVTCYKIKNFATSEYEEIVSDEQLIEDAVTWYQGASTLYKKRLLHE